MFFMIDVPWGDGAHNPHHSKEGDEEDISDITPEYA